MAPKQREARRAYRELMKAKQRLPKQRPGPRLTQNQGDGLPQTQEPPEPPPQPAPPSGEPPAPAFKQQAHVAQQPTAALSAADLSEQQKAARQAYKARIKSKGYAPSKRHGKSERPTVQDERAEAGLAAEAEQAWGAGDGDAKDQTRAGDAKAAVMDYFPGKKSVEPVVELQGAAGTAEPAGEARRAAEKRAKLEQKEHRKQLAQEAKAEKKKLEQEEKERRRVEKEEAKQAKREGRSVKEALYADPQPEASTDLKPNGAHGPDDAPP